jgi:ATP-dependent DNA ligase
VQRHPLRSTAVLAHRSSHPNINSLFQVACAHDLKGIMGKLANGRYHADGTSTI